MTILNIVYTTWVSLRSNGFVNLLVPIALFSSLSRWGLGTRIEGLWGDRIIELISIFFIGCLKQRNLERSQSVRADFWREKYETAVTSGV